MKTVDLQMRQVFHYSAPSVRAYVFPCMLAYYVEWQMRERLKPMLFDDEHLNEANASRPSPVSKAVRSAHAKAKDSSKRADDAHLASRCAWKPGYCNAAIAIYDGLPVTPGPARTIQETSQ